MKKAGIEHLPTRTRPQSLIWEGNELVDWVGGGRRWLASGAEPSAVVNYAYSFGRAVGSPSGRFSVIYADRQTKGLVLEHGHVLREINRSFYFADAYDYPVALGMLPDGREVMAHCPDSYNRIEIETLAEGQRLTQRESEAIDVFHSRLQFSPDGRYLLSAGWVWHPWNVLHVYDVAEALSQPASLDSADLAPPINGQVASAGWHDAQHIVVTTNDEDELDDESDDLGAGESGIWSLARHAWSQRQRDWNPLGPLYPCAGGLVYVEEDLRWSTPDGLTQLAWPELKIHHAPAAEHGLWPHPRPIIAVHPTHPRFAVVTETSLAVITLA
ncbi:hypothetical protein [Dyella silvatica]|uniref:hypothetical protein n=1 Tax=Dyella silvatica TaxID=2992128 RepID=UPI0022583DE3|nr:hypothetical protein [Dyella silvatica]